MTDTTSKLRALFLTALMVFSVFAGTVAFSGAAAAANTAGNNEAVAQSAVSYYNSVGNVENGDVTDNNARVEVTFNQSIESDYLLNAEYINVTLRDGDTLSYSGDANSGDVSADSGALEIALGDYNPVNVTEVSITTKASELDGDQELGSFANETVDVTQTTTTLAEDNTGETDDEVYKGERIALVADSAETTITVAKNGSFQYERGTGEYSDVYVVDTTDLEDAPYNFTFGENADAVDIEFAAFDFSASISDTEITQPDGETTLSAESNRIGPKVAFDLSNDTESKTKFVEIGSDGTASARFVAGGEDGDWNTLAESQTYGAEAVHLNTGVFVDLGDVTVNPEPPQDEEVLIEQTSYENAAGDIVEFNVSLSDLETGYVNITAGGLDMQVEAYDGSGDDSVTVRLNTYNMSATAAGDNDDTASVESVHDVDEYLLPGTFEMEAVTDANEGDAGGEVTDVATLQLTQPSLDGVSVHRAPADATLDSVESIEANVTETDEVALAAKAGDTDSVVIAYDVSGVFGAMDVEDVAWANWSVVEQANYGVDSLGDNADVYTDEENDRIYAVLDDLEGAEEGAVFDAGYKITGDEDLGADTTNPYWDESATVNTTFEIVDASATLDTVEAPYQVLAQEDSEIRGTATVAPGTTFNVRAIGAGNFLQVAEDVEVTEDGTWTATYDFSGQSVGTNFSVTVNEDYGAEDVDAVFSDTPEWESVETSEQLEQRIADLNTLLNETMDELNATENMVEEQASMLEDKNATIDEQQTTISGLEDEVSSLEDERDTLQNEVASLEDERDSLQNEVSTLEDEVSSLEDEVSNYESQVSSLEDEVSNYESQVSSLQSTLEDKNSTISDLESEIADLEEEAETTTTSGPGFTAVLALVALMGAALLAVRRQQ